MSNYISKNQNQTEEIAKEFLSKLERGKNQATVVALSGDLGAGKTTFVQFLAKQAGVTRKVTSPTFVIMKHYTLKNKNFQHIFHMDAYRLKDEKELENLGWGKIISNPKHLIFIEWPENIIKGIPKKHHQIKIIHSKKGDRRFQIKRV